MFKKLQQATGIEPNITSEESKVEADKKVEHRYETERPRILIVSNEKKIVDRLSLIFGDTYDVMERENLSMIFQLFANVKREEIDLVIYYDSNPRKDLSIISMMKKYPRFSNVPIVIIAQEITEKRKMHFLENDISDFIDMQNFNLIKQTVDSKIKTQSRINSIINYSLTHKSGLDIISNAHMHIRTLSDVAGCARTLKQLTNASINQERAFFELLLNSLEHGQLKINKEERLRMRESSDYESYLDILCSRNKEPIVTTFEKCENYYLINIIDGGDGFDYRKYLKTNLSESIKDTEKGIYIANNTKDFKIKYNDIGNIVQVKIPHKEKFKLWH